MWVGVLAQTAIYCICLWITPMDGETTRKVQRRIFEQKTTSRLFMTINDTIIIQ